MRIHHIALEVKNLGVSKTFYEEIFGFREHLRTSFQDEEIIFLEQDGSIIELIANKQVSSHSDHFHLCFEVDDVEKQITRLADYSFQPVEGPFDLENGWKTVFFQGPDKEIIELLQLDERK